MSSYAELAGELSETRRCHQTGVACSTGGDPGSWNVFEVCACVYSVCSYAALFRWLRFLCLSRLAYGQTSHTEMQHVCSAERIPHTSDAPKHIGSFETSVTAEPTPQQTGNDG